MRRLSLALLAVLSGCALLNPESADWQRQDTTPDQMSSDLAACRQAAEERYRQDQNTQQDIQSGPVGMGQDPLVTNLGGYQEQRDYQHMINDCMRAQGYGVGNAPGSGAQGSGGGGQPASGSQ